MQYIGIAVIFLTILGIAILFFILLKERKKRRLQSVMIIKYPSKFLVSAVKDAITAQHSAVSLFKKETEKFNTSQNT